MPVVIAAEQLVRPWESIPEQRVFIEERYTRGDHPFPANLADNPVHGEGREAAASEAALFREHGQ
jgi:hypothetical protein